MFIWPNYLCVAKNLLTTFDWFNVRLLEYMTLQHVYVTCKLLCFCVAVAAAISHYCLSLCKQFLFHHVSVPVSPPVSLFHFSWFISIIFVIGMNVGWSMLPKCLNTKKNVSVCLSQCDVIVKGICFFGGKLFNYVCSWMVACVDNPIQQGIQVQREKME